MNPFMFKDEPKLYDVFPNYLEFGAALTAWWYKTKNKNKPSLQDCINFDIWYMSRNGKKFASSFLQNLYNEDIFTVVYDSSHHILVDSEDNRLGSYSYWSLNRDKLGLILSTLFDDIWSKLFKAFQTDYNPLQPYQITISDTSRYKPQVTTTATYKRDDKTYTFNSTDQVPTDTTDTTNIYTHEGQDENTRLLTRTGNIGNTTNQELIKQEIELWRDSLYNKIEKDLNKSLTLHIYG